MPFRYAIQAEPLEPVSRHSDLTQSDDDYEEVPQIVAEMDEKNGRYAVFSSTGKRVGDWLPLKKNDRLQGQYDGWLIKESPVLKTGMGQKINRGDYVLAHDSSNKTLILGRVFRNARQRSVVEQFVADWYWGLTLTHIPSEALLRIPAEMVEDGYVPVERWQKKFAVCAVDGSTGRKEYYPVDEATAVAEPDGHFGLFNSEGTLVTGWVRITMPDEELQALGTKLTSPSYKKAVPELSVPLQDIFGTDLLFDDWVFSNHRNRNEFILCRVIGFTKNKVQLLGYSKYNDAGTRVVSLNWPENIVKLPVNIPE
jgi:hypothetical protein